MGLCWTWRPAETPRYGAAVAYHGPERPDRQPIVDVDHEIAVTASRSDDGPRARDSFRRLGSPGRPGPSLSEEYGLLMNTSYPYSDAVHGQWCWCRHPPALLRHGGPRLLQPPGGLARRRPPTCPWRRDDRWCRCCAPGKLATALRGCALLADALFCEIYSISRRPPGGVVIGEVVTHPPLATCRPGRASGSVCASP